MGLFRRSAKGRHALGAAVTSIPSAPTAAGFVPVSAPAAPDPAPAAADPAPSEPDVMVSIAALIATGEAWATEPIPAAPPPAAAVVEPPASGPAAVPFAPRVQLGFRDGSSTTLEPGSSQSRALEELAQSLTRRD